MPSEIALPVVVPNEARAAAAVAITGARGHRRQASQPQLSDFVRAGLDVSGDESNREQRTLVPEIFPAGTRNLAAMTGMPRSSSNLVLGGR